MKRSICVCGLGAALLAIPFSHVMIRTALANIGGDGTNGECDIESEFFASADGGCMDLATGLVWSSDLEIAHLGNIRPEDAEKRCDTFLNDAPEGNGFTDWRLPTIGEVEEAVANGLNLHLDFSYAPGFQMEFDPPPYRYTRCQDTRKEGKGKKSTKNLYIRYADGDILWSNSVIGTAMICVRGAAPLEFSCGPGFDAIMGGKGKGKNK